MHHETLKSETYLNIQSTTKGQRIMVKPSHTLEQYKEMVYLTKDYHTAIRRGTELPNIPLPKLDVLLEAHYIVDQYMKHTNAGLSLKLYNATLDTETVIAVWWFANHANFNVQIGNYALMSLKNE